jgi:hypothetical protein
MSQTCEKDRVLAQLQQEKLQLEQALKEEEKQYILKTEAFQDNIMQLTNEIDEHKARQVCGMLVWPDISFASDGQWRRTGGVRNFFAKLFVVLKACLFFE